MSDLLALTRRSLLLGVPFAGAYLPQMVRMYFAEAAGAAAKFLARPDGPRVGALAFDGWDMHINEGAVKGRLADLLGALDGAIAAIEANMGDAWRETVVALVTEFGRTAHINGSNGTDHGTATAALFAGGALNGERVIAHWPGLKETDLQDKRDLKPTTDLRSVLKGLLRDHLHLNQGHLEATAFSDSTAGGRVGFHSKRARHSLSNPVRTSNDARGNGR